jgi:multidrug/hemolysin transport system ATP-binding protein
MNIIEIKHLYKSFGEIKAVNDLTFRVKKGEFFSFLGVNGAGKSTTISIIAGLLLQDSGDVLVCGKKAEDNASSKNIGIVFQSSALDKTQSVLNNLISRAALYGIYKTEFNEKIEELDELLKIKELLPRKLGSLSGGQKRRVDIARALIHSPEILILDEPTTGLDPQTRKMLWDAIQTLRINKGLTVFLTTHYMEEAAESDYVIILDQGRVVAEGRPIDLKNKYTKDYITIYSNSEDEIKDLNIPYKKVLGGFRFEVENTNEAKNLILKHPTLFNDFEITKGKMDDVFLQVTGKTLTGGTL